METKFAHLISYIFHPLLMPTYVFILLFNQKAYFAMIIPDYVRLRMLFIVFIVTFIIPLSFILLIKNLKIIKSLQMHDRKERNIPYLITMFFLFILYLIFKNILLSPIYKYFMVGTVLLITIAFIINLKWKISIHMIAIGGVIGMVLGLTFSSLIFSPLYLFCSIFIAGLIGFARLSLNVHTQAQVYTGLFSGIALMMILALYF